MMTDERELVQRFLRGDAEAVATLNGWIERAAWSYQRRLAHRWDDVLQDVRLEVTRLLGEGKFRGESSLRTYLWRVVSHTCLDQIRSQAKWQWADLEVLEQDDGHAAGPAISAISAISATLAISDPVERDLLMRVLDRSSQDCRELWRMLLLGHSYREMSQRLDVAEGTLRVRVLRCRERAVALRDELLGGRSLSVTKSPRERPSTTEG